MVKSFWDVLACATCCRREHTHGHSPMCVMTEGELRGTKLESYGPRRAGWGLPRDSPWEMCQWKIGSRTSDKDIVVKCINGAILLFFFKIQNRYFEVQKNQKKT